MSDMTNQERLSQLLEKSIDDNLSLAQATELNDLLRQPEAKQHYLGFMELHSRLSRLLAAANKSSKLPRTSLDIAKNLGVPFSKWVLSMAMVAAMIPLFIFGGQLMLTWNTSESFAARIVRKVDCDIELSRWDSRPTNNLVAGQVISLNRGLLSLEFGCGATVALQGPAEFEVVSDQKGYLQYGKLTAKVPPEAIGFTIETPTCRSVDLGTEFGMAVDVTGASETHVFEGEVLVYGSQHLSDLNPNDSKTSKEAIKLTENQASRVTDSLASAVEFAAKPESFLRLPDHIENEVSKHGNLPFTELNRPKLWLDAAKHVQVDPLQRVISWLDLTAFDGLQAENAWQLEAEDRPILIESGLNGLPAVRFMGKEKMITEPIATGDQITIFTVLRMLPQKLRRGRNAGILCVDSMWGLRIYRDGKHHLNSKKPGYWKNGKEQFAAWNLVEADLQNIPLVVAFVYDRSTSYSGLLANGVEFNQRNAWAKIAVDKSWVIGSLPENSIGNPGFVGDIAEILLFDSALQSKQIKEISRWLMDKYSIQQNGKVLGEPISLPLAGEISK